MTARTILIAGPHSPILTRLSAILRKSGTYRIAHRTDGASAWRQAVSMRPGIVICSEHASPLDGRSFIRLLGTTGVCGLEHVRVILLTDSSVPLYQGDMIRDVRTAFLSPLASPGEIAAVLASLSEDDKVR